MIRRPLGRALWTTAAVALVAACAPVLFLQRGAAAGVTPGIKPDIVLSSSQPRYARTFASILVNDLTPQADPAVVPTPDQCRLPALDLYCDVFRVRIVRSRAPGASNFVQLSMSWPKQASTPALALGVAGLSDSDLPDLELFLYKDADTYIDYELVGGRSAITPERLVWEATQDEYDVVVRSGLGVGVEYSLRALYSNELFDKPFELLDDVVGTAPIAPVDGSADTPVSSGSAAPAAPPLALAPIDVDHAIAGIGLGVTEQFDPELLDLDGAAREVLATSDPPSTLMLILALLAAPAAFASLILFALRRRHAALVS